MPRTQRDKIVDAMESDGWILDIHTRVTKTLVYRRCGIPVRVYLGKSGSMRYSMKGTRDTAFPVKESLKLAYVNRGANVVAAALKDFTES